MCDFFNQSSETLKVTTIQAEQTVSKPVQSAEKKAKNKNWTLKVFVFLLSKINEKENFLSTNAFSLIHYITIMIISKNKNNKMTN